MGDAFETPRGDEFTSCLFSATSATAKLTGPERSGEILPIIVWLTESLQQPIVGGGKKYHSQCCVLDTVRSKQWPEPISYVLYIGNEGTEPPCSLMSSFFVGAHAEASICILCLQVINAQRSCNI